MVAKYHASIVVRKGDGGGAIDAQPMRCLGNRLTSRLGISRSDHHRLQSRIARPPPRDFTLHSFALHISFLFVANMLSTTRSAVSMALRGASPPLQTSLFSEANAIYSQASDCAHAIPRWQCSLPILKLLRQGCHDDIACHNPW
jgi:hypothetical protein